MHKALVSTLCLGLAATAFAQAPELRLYDGAPDTTYAESTNLVLITTPGASATINGQDVKVYKTGSFGKKIDLNPGANSIDVVVKNNAGTTNKTFTVFRSTQKPAPRRAEREVSETRFMEPVFVTTKQGAYLQYGNGNDRLGGSKMGFIDSGITLKAIGERGSLYCVRLSADRIGYLPKEYAEPAAQPIAGAVNTGSWSVADAGKYDRVSVALPRRLAYQYRTDIQPNTLIVEVFGATDNSNWITQRTLKLGIIDYVDFEQVADDHYRVIIRLKDRYNWGFKVGYEGNALTIDVRHRPASLALKDLVIGLDAGHGGQYPGAKSPSGLVEKEVNLDIVKHIKSILEKKGAKVVMTREGDTGPSMGERKQIWRENNCDLAISVHNNAGGSPFSSPGTAVLYKHLFDRPLAEMVTARLLETGLPLFGIVQNFNFSLNGPTECPNVLVEGMFMSSLEEEERLADPEFRRLVADKIVAAIEDYLKSAK